jgi:hypothetical protein
MHARKINRNSLFLELVAKSPIATVGEPQPKVILGTPFRNRSEKLIVMHKPWECNDMLIGG